MRTQRSRRIEVSSFFICAAECVCVCARERERERERQRERA